MTRAYLIVVSVLNGLAGLVCGVLLITRPDGRLLQMGALLPVVRTMPFANVFFRDFFWLGVAMLVVLGVPNLTAAVMLLRRSGKQYRATLAAAALLVLWCVYESVYLFNAAAVGYFIVGVASVLASVTLLRATAKADAMRAHRTDTAR